MALFKPEFGLVFWMLIVFLIILGILAKYAWPVIIRSIESRADFIDSGVKYAEETKKQLDEAQDKVHMLLEDAHRQQMETLRETEQIKQGMIEEARQLAGVEAQKVIDAAQLSAKQLKQETELQLRRQVSKLSLEIAGRLLRKNLENDQEQEELINRMLDEIE